MPELALLACPSCRGDQTLDVTGNCERCRGEWLSAAHVEAAAPGRIAFLRKHISRGPPTPQNCPSCRGALKAFDIPGFQHEGDLFWGKEQPRADTHSVGEGCAACGGVWMEADQLFRAGARRDALANVARLAESLA